MRRARLAVVWLWIVLAAFLATPASAAQIGEVVVLFDQSGSIKKYDPRLASKVWLKTFLRTFETPHRIVFSGFDEEIRDYIEASTDNPEDMDELAANMGAVAAGGRATDLESPFRLLLDRGGADAIKLALIVTDGEPEIWDKKLGYLSKAVRADERYADLNREFHALESQGVGSAELFDRLSNRYHLRNIEHIESLMPAIGRNFGGKLIIWDLSGRSYYLRTWARMAGAQHLSIRLVDGEKPVERLRDALVALQEKASEMVDEPLPPDHRALVESVLAEEPETKADLKPVGEGMPVAVPEPPPPPPEKKAEPAPDPPSTVPVSERKDGAPWPWILLAAVLLILALFSIRRVAARSKASDKDGPEFDVDAGFIQDQVKDALAQAESMRRDMIDRTVGYDGPERRFAVRVPVLPGAMTVSWTNSDGSAGSGNGIDMSMHGVLFEAKGFDAKAIDTIAFSRHDVVLTVKRAEIHERDGDRVAAVIEEFDNNVDDRMTWIEMLTRVAPESAG